MLISGINTINRAELLFAYTASSHIATRVLDSKVVNSGWEKRLGCFAGSACPSLRPRSTRTLVLDQSIALAVCRLFRGTGGVGAHWGRCVPRSSWKWKRERVVAGKCGMEDSDASWHHLITVLCPLHRRLDVFVLMRIRCQAMSFYPAALLQM